MSLGWARMQTLFRLPGKHDRLAWTGVSEDFVAWFVPNTRSGSARPGLGHVCWRRRLHFGLVARLT